jgi:hypothetical protein
MKKSNQSDAEREKFHKNPIKRGTFFRDINHIFSRLLSPSLPVSLIFFKWKIYCFFEMCTCTRFCDVCRDMVEIWKERVMCSVEVYRRSVAFATEINRETIASKLCFESELNWSMLRGRFRC